MDARSELERALAALRGALEDASRSLTSQSLEAPPELEAALEALQGLVLAAEDPAAGRGTLDWAQSLALGGGDEVSAAAIGAWRALTAIRASPRREDVAQAREAIAALARLDRPWAALAMAERLVQALRRAGAVEEAIAQGEAIAAASWPDDMLERALMLQALVAETCLLGGLPAEGLARMQAIEARARRHGLWRVQHRLAVSLAFDASQRGEVPRAETCAEQARALAVAHRDPHRYLVAAQLLADLAEQRGDHPAAYGITVRAIRSLSQLLGPSFEATGRRMLSALRDRWGEELYDRAAATFVTRAQAME